ncbi:MAG: isoaspartyl peptidase/L-asparaginase, partial [Candidatus Binataceae bacterium]
AAALDARGGLAAATSTGGYLGKLPGRVGDSAILGAGFFAAEMGAASATGLGEAIVKLGMCREAVMTLGGARPAVAAARAIADLGMIPGGEGGIVLVDRRGRVGYAHNAEAMEVAIFQASGGLRHFAVKPQTRSR